MLCALTVAAPPWLAGGPSCGDGVVNGGEQCDDGNAVPGDGCEPDCQTTFRLVVDRAPGPADVRLSWSGGVPLFQVRRSVDPARLGDPASLLGSTSLRVWNDPAPPEPLLYYRIVALCGNGTLDAGEQCDDGNNLSRDGCSAECAALVSDDFSPTLAPFWSYSDPVGDVVQGLTGAGTPDSLVFLRIPGGVNHNAWNALDSPRLMQKVDDVDFEIETRFQSSVSQGNEFQGIVVLADAQNWLRFDFHSDGLAWRAFAGKTVAGVSTVAFNPQLGPGASPANLWMRVKRQGNQWTFSWSTDPQAKGWSVAGSFPHTLAVREAGVFAGNFSAGSAPPHEARIDYFFNTAAPVVDEDPITCGNGTPEPWEECDDGNTANGDLCQADCTLPACGDAILDGDEECDLGAANSDIPDAACRTDCSAGRCGDAILDGGEECDLGAANSDLPDADCRTDCSPGRCGDTIVDGGEECDLGAANSDLPDADCRTDCSPGRCGDAILDQGEICDDGAANSDVPDADCRSDCTAQRCGDGTLDTGEDCDDGAANSDLPDAACRADCSPRRCGDGIVDQDETCDDGNQQVGDGCRPDCTDESCGDGIPDPNEECDDGNVEDGDGCQAACTMPACGDGIVDPGEACDDGAANSDLPDAHCRTGCGLGGCGDLILDSAEDCDDGNTAGGDGCRPDCTVEACGDGIADPGEQCDDGNDIDGDGCQADCTLPLCGDGITDPGEQCDDGNGFPGDGCRADCTEEICGDGTLDPGEDCDDGSANSDAPDADCRTDCTPAGCADGIVDSGEDCDDGNTMPGDGCSATCESLVSDDFSPAANDGWTLFSPLGDASVHTTGAGTADAWMVLSVPGGVSHDAWNATLPPRVLQEADDSDFEVEIKLETALALGNQFQGLWIEQDAGTWLRFDVLYDGVEWHLHAASTAGGVSTKRIDSPMGQPVSPAPIWLRVTRAGDAWFLRFSTDPLAKAFSLAGTFSHTLAVSRVGMFAGNAGANPPVTARFDYFFETGSPIDPEDPVTCGNGILDAGEGCDAGEANSDAPDADCRTDCTDAGCGDGILDGGEDCDDGNSADADGCSADCVAESAYCGNSVLDPGEQCDDGNTTSGDGCSATCHRLVSDDFSPARNPGWAQVDPLGGATFSVVGAGTANSWMRIAVPGGVAHDAWNAAYDAPRLLQHVDDGDFTVEVRLESPVGLGNQFQGLVFEQDSQVWLRCDVFSTSGGQWRLFAASTTGGVSQIHVNVPGGSVPSPAPLWLRVARAGDAWTFGHSTDGSSFTFQPAFSFAMDLARAGVIAGNAVANPAHTASFDYFFDVAAPVDPEDPLTCGDGTLDPGEQCDEGAGNSGLPDATCRLDCTFGRCGDAVVDTGEQCDDGNTTPDDGCTGACQWEAFCGNGLPDAGEECDDGAGNSPEPDATCRENCMLAGCGDGVVDSGEQCDDGNTTPGDGCAADCTDEAVFCGDGVIGPGEDCDDGNLIGGDGCSATCGGIVSDDFSPGRNPGWTEVDPIGDVSFATVGGGSADAWQIIAIPAGTSHDAFGTLTAPRIMQRADDSDFTLEVKLDLPVSEGNEFQGLLVRQDDLNWVRFDVYSNGSAWFVFAARTLAGTSALQINDLGGSGASPAPLWLQVEREGHQWTLRHSTDGTTFTNHNPFVFALAVAEVGLMAGTGVGNPAHVAAFDYLFDSSDPVVPEDPVTCGNSSLDPGEGCDDGNTANGDGCRANCTIEICGDGLHDPPAEQCDDGNGALGDGCRPDCTLEICGDGTLDAPGEQCDDGNTVPGDGCQADCRLPACGDGVHDTGEDCDDGNLIGGDGCSPVCGQLLSDDFSPFRRPGWTEINPLNDAVFANPGGGTGNAWQVIEVPAGVAHDAWSVNRAPRVVQKSDNPSEFTVEVKLDSSVSMGNQFQGILIEQGPTRWLRFDVYSDGTQWRLLAAHTTGSTTVADFDVAGGSGPSPVPLWLRVVRTSLDWTLLHSTDGSSWTSDGTLSFGLFTNVIGIQAGNGGAQPAHTAIFDYLFDAADPEIPEDPVTCGNAQTDPGEQCDDGNGVAGDGCRPNCTVEICGDGILDPGEACDDGNLIGGDGCQPTCLLPACGDAVLDPGEECDDGNTVSGDGCQAGCLDPTCGDGTVDAGEECDDGNTASGDGCQSDCLDPVCGDMILDPGETCDDGNVEDGDGCSHLCLREPRCGNGVVEAGETCDEGPANSNLPNATCRVDCSLARCGDGIEDAGEQCDDGNTDGGDGCSGSCALESGLCGNGTVDPGEDCDDGNTTGGDGCSTQCRAFVADDFSPFAGPGWVFVNPLGDATWWIAGAGTPESRLVISVPPGASHLPSGSNQAPRLMQKVDDVDFEIEFRVLSRVASASQFEGLIVEQDAANWLRFGFNSNGTEWFATAASTVGGVTTLQINQLVGAAPSPGSLFMRVKRQGQVWSQQYSLDGSSWTSPNSFVRLLSVASLGLFAGNGTGSPSPPFYAAFDFIESVDAPIALEDPVTCGNSLVQQGEECDDGNTLAGDGCSDECKTLISDDFSPAPNAGWIWFNPRGDASWSATGGGTPNARVTLTVPNGSPHDAWLTNRAPRLVQFVDDRNFTLEVKLESSVGLANQFQGILVEESESRWLRADVVSDGVSWKIFAGSTIGTTSTVRRDVTIGAGPSPSPLWLRLARNGDTWTVSHSTNGVSFTAHNSFIFAMTARFAGVMAGNGPPGSPAVSAVFDYFFDAAAPVTPEDP